MTGWIPFCPHNRNGTESGMGMSRGSRDFGYTSTASTSLAVGELLQLLSAAAISSGWDWLGIDYNNNGDTGGHTGGLV